MSSAFLAARPCQKSSNRLKFQSKRDSTSDVQARAYARKHPWPDNAWLGASIEDQKRAVRAQIITRIPAPVRFLSVEPLLGPVTLDLRGIDWVIVGGESGHGHRPMAREWAISVRDQCRAAGVPLWFKQWGGLTPNAGGHLLDGVVHHEFPTPFAAGAWCMPQ